MSTRHVIGALMLIYSMWAWSASSQGHMARGTMDAVGSVSLATDGQPVTLALTPFQVWSIVVILLLAAVLLWSIWRL